MKKSDFENIKLVLCSMRKYMKSLWYRPLRKKAIVPKSFWITQSTIDTKILQRISSYKRLWRVELRSCSITSTLNHKAYHTLYAVREAYIPRNNVWHLSTYPHTTVTACYNSLAQTTHNRRVTELFAVWLFTVGHSVVGQFAVRTLRGTDTSS